jgi:hypothetical protein
MTLFKIKISRMQSRQTTGAAIHLFLQFSLFSAVLSYSLKIPSDSIEFLADRALNGDAEFYRSMVDSVKQQRTDKSNLEQQQIAAEKDVKSMGKFESQSNILNEITLGRAPLPRPFPLGPSPKSVGDQQILTSQEPNVETHFYNNAKTRSQAVKNQLPSDTPKFNTIGSEQIHLKNLKKQIPLTPDLKFYAICVLTVRN